ncbi:MAG: 2-polyprenyl-3-methyl-5-hydroxy-6-metoxy-1,4-benzoquinol methylase [Chloroflexi bacterium AL-W]|nr:2-polyprenyl-3-methyl-5-hydroxy-6-metoxy-1,4-benzoquinol methylase [Chloroflexi bacterium AL-N1]NOK68936.1 2-polyprenyl-3-methyl-5-hydroxy-6-metoxy-1,4-benzoquinol methylase [Chloroflexi bacterium AL-N10]NOK82693.1 2-polyprenyl-3-methyl-5-hydroxy-6-metoxy-1,4-benzoquinol methylase [Chloroflexi bacterium AL-W]
MASQEQETIAQKIAQFPHWYHQIEVAPGVVTPGINATPLVLELLDLPEDCTGMRALDIGARDGFFSFELEKRGANVLALDYVEPTQTGFAIAKELLQSQVEYKVANVYDLNPEDYGTFDIVLFLGVLYHLRNPLLALDKIWSVCSGQLWIESQVIDNAFLDYQSQQLHPLSVVSPNLTTTPIMQFYPQNTLNNDFTNWWAPNMACLTAMLEDANFVVERSLLHGSRGIAHCRVNNDKQINHYRNIENSIVGDH